MSSDTGGGEELGGMHAKATKVTNYEAQQLV